MRNSPSYPLLLTATIWFSVYHTDAAAQITSSSSSPVQAGSSLPAAPTLVSIRKDASDLELFAASELRRYVYLRTGKLLPVTRKVSAGDRIVVSRKDAKFCGRLGSTLGPQQFTLQTSTARDGKVWWIVGGDEVGTLYGAYRFAEKLGVRFGVDGDVLPDEPFAGDWPEPSETGKPRFALRGLQPFHDFSVGPDWWNLQDYQSVLSQMAKLKMNFIGFHTYPSWNPAAGPEANVWIGLPEDVDARGDVRFGYEAGVVTTRRGWEVTPFPTSKYASGASLLFDADDYGPDFMLDCLEWPKTAEAGTAMFNRCGDLQQKAFDHARRLGIKTCVGTELPLGVPKALAARLEAQGMKPGDPATIRRLYEGAFLRLMRKMPVDFYWLWAAEAWLGREPGSAGWEVASTANVERELGLIQEAADSVNAPFRLATCGWRLGTRQDALWMDQRTPKSWAASSINTSLGRDPVEKAYDAMPGRPKWVIGWAEDDDTAGAHCCTCWDLQLWAERMFANSADALRYGCEGMMAIHWRTAGISPNIAALAQAGWDLEGLDNSSINSSTDASLPQRMNVFWADWGRGMFGGDAGAGAGRIIQKLDGAHLGINALIRGGAGTTDAQVAALFAPLRELEALRPRIKGIGCLERFDYWLNLIQGSQLRVRTWVLAARLTAKMKEASAITEADRKQALVRSEALPLRLEIARSYEDLIAAFVHCARSPGEIGTIASIESGTRARIVSAHDQAIAQILAAPLPAEAAVRTAYRGTPRIFVAAPRTQVKAGERQALRAFVLSDEKCTGVNLYWRPLGECRFKKLAATLRARQAYRVALPAMSKGAVEYYLEAALGDGRQVRWPATAPSICQTATVW
jgi:hypothetical protein